MAHRTWVQEDPAVMASDFRYGTILSVYSWMPHGRRLFFMVKLQHGGEITWNGVDNGVRMGAKPGGLTLDDAFDALRAEAEL